MNGEKGIIAGPPLEDPIPDCSLGELLFSKLKRHPKGNTIQVDAITGFSESSMDLLEKSLKVGKGLQSLGLGQDDVVALIARNCSDIFAAVLGVLFYGGIVAPMDTELKIMDFKHLLGNVSKPKAIICDEHVVPIIASALDGIGRESLIIVLADSKNVKKPHIPFEDLLKAEIDVDAFVAPTVEFPSTKVAVILTTSGSTGMPKGAGITHRNLIFQMMGFRKNVIGLLDDCLVLSHLYWLSGIATLLISVDGCKRRIYMTEINAENSLASIQKYRSKGFIISPPVFLSWINTPNFENYDLSSVQYIIVGGCVISQSVIEAAKKIWKDRLPICNMYGCSECSGPISVTPLGKDLLSVGKVCSGVKVKIMDTESGKTLGPNQRGEIAMQSEGIMKHYVGNEMATKEVMLDGWLRTGDLGYFDEEENLFVVDRIKEIIKSGRAQMVSPCEVEYVIELIPGVTEAGVVGQCCDSDEFYLIALVVKNNPNVTEEDIKTFVKENLADFKCPKLVKFVSKIPRSPVGKIKRKELKTLAASMVD